MNFRYDINGLRAIAIIAVVLFHFNESFLSGGFAGVDVFFVISGFLMTKIIFDNIQTNTFNLFKFYIARINRIFPALATVCAVLIVFGWFILPPLEYTELARQIVHSGSFTSNSFFAKDLDYFSVSAKEKWLLHTWSLSIEWQFYLLYPILIFIAQRYFKTTITKTLVLICAGLSLIFCIYFTHHSPSDSYYSFFSRCWEMLAGAIVYLFPLKKLAQKQKTALTYFGLFLILLSYCLISDENHWPGFLALIPILGSCLILMSQNQHSKLLNSVILQRIGTYSYSIYLWHWPVLVVGLFFAIPNWWIYGIPLSLVLGAISYHVIETYRFKTYESIKDIYKVIPLLVMIVLIGLASYIKKTNGVEKHYSEAVRLASFEANNKNPYLCKNDDAIFSECKIGNKDHIAAIAVGDSHSKSISTAIGAVFDLQKNGIDTFNQPGCPFILNTQKTEDNNSECLNQNTARFEALRQSKTIPIIITNRWASYIYGEIDPSHQTENNRGAQIYFESNTHLSDDQLIEKIAQNFKTTVCTLSKNSPVFIVQPIPDIEKDIPRTLSRELMQGKQPDLAISKASYEAKTAKIRKMIQETAYACHATVLDPAQTLCASGRCIATYQSRPIYTDGNHLSEYGNKLLVPMFKQALHP